MNLYKLATTENVDLNYKAFKKDELIDCILNLRTTYFRLKKENEEVEQLKEVIDKAIAYIKGAYEMALYTKSVSLEEENIEELLDILKEVE